MYFLSLFRFAVCIVVLMESKCAARRPNNQGENGQYVTRTRISSPKCEDNWGHNTCQAAKQTNRCDILMYKEHCKKTCNACSTQSSVTVPKIEENTSECRDIGTPEFCQSVQPICQRLGFGGHSRARFALRYCKKTCGVCRPQPTSKPEVQNTCVDRPICKKLTMFYKITSCITLPRQLKKRAIRKCPRLCGLCVAGQSERKEPEVAQAKKRVVDYIESAKTRTSNERKRQPQPLFQRRESDQEPRRGVFYIYTKYLSL